MIYSSKGVIHLKKFLNRLVTRHFFSYMVIFFLFLYLINNYKGISLKIGGFIFFFVLFSLIENSYQQNIEDKAAGVKKLSSKEFIHTMKNQTFKQFIHSIDWFYVFGVSFLVVVLYLFILILLPLWMAT